MIVVDTNVVVHLLVSGPQGEAAAQAFRRDPEWAAPVILLSEVRNVLAGLVRRRGLPPDDALAMLADAEAILGGRVVTVDGARVLAAALDTGLSAIDAEFVVAARALGVPLLSADRAICAAAPDVAVALE